MLEKENIKISSEQVSRARKKIPKEDFIDVAFDKEVASGLRGIFFLLSTPRSGSTYLSDLLYRNDFCLPHEYFQPSEYLPILASRWKCLHEGVLSKEEYVKKLVKFRTSGRGWLGINLHGRHLPIFEKFEGVLPKAEKKFVHLRRKDLVAQAVSYELARQTGIWSSHFTPSGSAQYSFGGIKRRLREISYQDTLIASFLRARSIRYTTLFYEDLASDPASILKDILEGSFDEDKIDVDVKLTKQSSQVNREWASNFSVEYFATLGAGYEAKKNVRSILGRVARNILKKI